jgi:hypothetical protein
MTSPNADSGGSDFYSMHGIRDPKDVPQTADSGRVIWNRETMHGPSVVPANADYVGHGCPHCDRPVFRHEHSVRDIHGEVWHQRCYDIFDDYAKYEASPNDSSGAGS